MTRRPHLAARFGPLVALLASLAFVAAACGSSTPALSDPKEILSKGIASLQGLKAFHVDVALAGSISINMSDPTAGGGTPFPLDGSSLTADVDVAGKKISASVVVSVLRADLLMTGDSLYMKAPLLGSPKWIRTPVTSSVSSAVTDPQQTIGQIKQFLDQPGVSPAKQPNEKVGDQDCYKVTFTVPASMLNSAIGAVAGAAGAAASALPAGITVSDLPVTAWVSTADQRLTKLALDVPLGAAGTVSVTVTLSKFDQPVIVTPPPADQVQTTGSG